MEIKVEQRHIDAGKQCVSDSCPVALAIREAVILSDFAPVQVGRTIFRVGATTYNTPKSVTKFIKEFDSYYGEPKPFSFSFEV